MAKQAVYSVENKISSANDTYWMCLDFSKNDTSYTQTPSYGRVCTHNHTIHTLKIYGIVSHFLSFEASFRGNLKENLNRILTSFISVVDDVYGYRRQKSAIHSICSHSLLLSSRFFSHALFLFSFYDHFVVN